MSTSLKSSKLVFTPERLVEDLASRQEEPAEGIRFRYIGVISYCFKIETIDLSMS